MRPEQPFDVRDFPLQTAAIGDITLAYRVFGEGDPVLLINGFASGMDTWNPPVLAALAEEFRVVVFDNRGTGYSGSSGEEYSIPLFARDTVALLDVLGLGSVRILGHSLGAMIALELAVSFPERVERMVLVSGDCGGAGAVCMSTETRRVLTDKSGSPREQAERMFTVLFPREWRDSHDPWDFCPPVYETTPEDQAARQAAVLSSWDGVCGQLAGIRSPTLVVTGTDDVIIPPANADILARNIPGARLVRFRDCGHGLMYQVPAPFAAVVVGFFGG